MAISDDHRNQLTLLIKRMTFICLDVLKIIIPGKVDDAIVDAIKGAIDKLYGDTSEGDM